ncbi:hypothetical protein [Piscinibacter sp.]|uniref:hypothetical protein n=1 Tax=Piscinibacter sp. TaxID=1903157 RepID=UPI0039E40F93
MAAAGANPAIACGNCHEPMQVLRLPGHYGRTVEVDLCSHCHLVWFDLTETARLSGAALLALIEAMAGTQSLPHLTLQPGAGCARCGAALKTVHNRSRWGSSLHLECRNGHGAYQSFAQFLQEKGLLRPMSRIDRARLLQTQGRIDCVNCGAAIARDDATCGYCGSVPSLLDVARLARALDPEGALEPQAVHRDAARQQALQCGACGAALPPGLAVDCAQCGATLAISRLADAHARVATLGPALRAHAEKPSPEVIKRRLDALDADLPRRRDYVAQMEAETDARRGRNRLGGEAWDWSDLLGGGTNPLRAVLIALLVWFVWYFWR